MEIIKDCEQGSDLWHLHRIGSVGGSSINSVLAKGKGASRKTLMYKLAGEILSGCKTDGYKSADMQRGNDFEDEARQYYEFVTGNTVEQVALIKSDIPGTHNSPDGLIGSDGGIEIKVRLPHVYVELIETGKIEIGYKRQCQHFLWITGREWIDYINYCPEIKKNPMQKIRIFPDPEIIGQIKIELPLFLKELDEMVQRVGG